MIVVNRISGQKMSRTLLALSLLGAVLILALVASPVFAQSAEADPPAAETETTAVPEESRPDADPVALAEAALASEEPEPEAATSAGPVGSGQINLLELLVKGGYLMIPIGVMSLIVVTFGLERWLGLRRRRVLPPRLIRDIGRLAMEPDGFDPRQAYDLCQLHPSTAGRVIKTMLLKAGRPHAEVERAVRDSCQREADRLYANVRWLSLAAGVAPLLGLLGTVWGMIQAFFATANLPTGANKGEILAQGIYVALVTTFAGLAVAIPAAVLAHLFEGRIQKLFRQLDETLSGLLSQMERLEGKLKVRHEPVVPGEANSGKINEENMTLRMYRTAK
jgi:biopolymer transport protein ExbB